MIDVYAHATPFTIPKPQNRRCRNVAQSCLTCSVSRRRVSGHEAGSSGCLGLSTSGKGRSGRRAGALRPGPGGSWQSGGGLDHRGLSRRNGLWRGIGSWTCGTTKSTLRESCLGKTAHCRQFSAEKCNLCLFREEGGRSSGHLAENNGYCHGDVATAAPVSLLTPHRSSHSRFFSSLQALRVPRLPALLVDPLRAAERTRARRPATSVLLGSNFCESPALIGIQVYSVAADRSMEEAWLALHLGLTAKPFCLLSLR